MYEAVSSGRTNASEIELLSLMKLCAALEKGSATGNGIKDAGMYSDELLLKCREAIRGP